MNISIALFFARLLLTMHDFKSRWKLKYFFLALIIMVPSLLMVPSTFARNPVVKAGSRVSRICIRSEASLTANVLGYLEKGIVVEVVDESTFTSKIDGLEDHWYQVANSSKILGWVFGGYIGPILGDASSPVQSVQNDVISYGLRRILCNHWGGEDAFDEERAQDITDAVSKLRCNSLEKEYLDLELKYKDVAAVLKQLKIYNDTYE